MSVAIDLSAEFGLVELLDDIEGMRQAILADEELAPHVYDRNVVLRDRWRARYMRQLGRAIQVLRTSDSSAASGAVDELLDGVAVEPAGGPAGL